MMRTWIFIVLMVGEGFLFLTVVQGQVQPQPNFANSDDAARGKILLPSTVLVVMGLRAKG